MLLTKVEVNEAEARLFVTTVSILKKNEWDVDRAMPALVAKLQSSDKKMMTALLLTAANDPFMAPYHDDLLTENLMGMYAKSLVASYCRKEAGNGSDL